MSKFYKYEKATCTKRPKGNPNEIFFDGWSIIKREGGYFVNYISSAHGGGEKTFGISEEDYSEAKAGNKGLLELLKKYN